MEHNFKEPGKLLFASWNIDLDEVPIEQLDHYIAVENFLTDEDEDKADAENIEKVRGYLSAFHHLCEVGNWFRVSEIISIRLNTPSNEELQNQLFIWGYYREQINLYNQLLGNLSYLDGLFLGGLGNANLLLGNYPQAIDYLQKHLTITRLIGDGYGEGLALGNLGVVYFSLGNYSQAIDYYQQSLTIVRSISNRDGEGTVLGNLGIVYLSQGNYLQAIDYHQQSLTIFRSVGNRHGEGSALGNLGDVYRYQGDYYGFAHKVKFWKRIYKGFRG